MHRAHHYVKRRTMRLKSDAKAKRIAFNTARTLDFLPPMKGACCPTSFKRGPGSIPVPLPPPDFFPAPEDPEPSSGKDRSTLSGGTFLLRGGPFSVHNPEVPTWKRRSPVFRPTQDLDSCLLCKREMTRRFDAPGNIVRVRSSRLAGMDGIPRPPADKFRILRFCM